MVGLFYVLTNDHLENALEDEDYVRKGRIVTIFFRIKKKNNIAA
jgi:hypothetical protein